MENYEIPEEKEALPEVEESASEILEEEVEEEVREPYDDISPEVEKPSAQNLTPEQLYDALKSLGVSNEDAYYYSYGKNNSNGRAHLKTSVPPRVKSPSCSMSQGELDDARAIFSDMTDTEIRNLYKKVIK